LKLGNKTGCRALYLGLALATMTLAARAAEAQDQKPNAPVPKFVVETLELPAANVPAQDPGQQTPSTPSTGSATTQGQSTGSTGSSTSTPAPNGQTPAATGGPDHSKDEVPKRIFFIIPNFMTANDQPENQGPLTPKQKFNIAWHQWYDMSAHFGNILQAGISQAADGEPHYGQGWGAFGERFAAQEGDQFTGSFLIYGILPTVLHQDPRYFRRGKGSALSRIGYAASRVVIARKDDGDPTFNFSQVFGQLGQAGISLSYYPQQDRDVHGLLVGWAINQIYNIGWNQLKEFTPDLGALIARHQKKKKHATDVNDSRSPIAPAANPNASPSSTPQTPAQTPPQSSTPQ
jgi:hypothetical protein